MDINEAFNITAALNETNGTVDEEDWEITYDDGNASRISLELFTVVSLVSVLASGLLVFVILKFPKLRQSVRNILILHINVIQLLYLVCTPITARLVVDLDLISSISLTTFCILNELESVLLIVLFLLFVLLTVDWYLKVYHTDQRYAKFRNVYKFFLIVIYVFCTFIAVLTTQFCLKYVYVIAMVFVDVLLYLIILVFVIVINIVHKCKSRHINNNKFSNNVGLVMVNIFVATWLPALICLLVNIFCPDCVIALLFIVLTTLGFISPLLNCIFLYCVDDNFHIFIKCCLKCKCNSYQNEALLSQENQSVSFSTNSEENVVAFSRDDLPTARMQNGV